MPRIDCPESEFARSSRGQMLSAVLKDPEAKTWSDKTPRRMAMERAVLSVREKSSHALRDCFVAGDPPPPASDGSGRPTTRTAMIEARRARAAEENYAIGKNTKATLPVGKQPGAPGKTPGYQKFTHHDVDRNDPKKVRC